VAPLLRDLEARQARAAGRYADAAVLCERSQRLIMWSHVLARHRSSHISGGSDDGGGAVSRTILVVDDQPVVRSAMAGALAAAGFDVREASTGRDAVRLARLSMHLIVLDLVLPDMTGYEVLRKLKADPATKDIPVVIKTEFLSVDGIGHVALAVGATAYFTAVYDPPSLIPVVRRALGQRDR